MEERLVDVLNDKNTVLHVFPVAVESDLPPNDVDFEQEALKAAIAEKIVPEPDLERLHARLHVSRGGPLTPFADALQVKCEQKKRIEQRIRDRAYFLWQQAGCAENRADEHWHRARELEGASAD
ncbi:MAG: DUF2934 domain-containing protein [Pseudomonadota bacterium]|nr:DUF2934 domain-containing protein [Pseudomonadota bacterium]